MPELPEIASRTREMKKELVGKTISGIEVKQPKSLNVSLRVFQAGLVRARILDVACHGKWIFVETTKGWLLINLGMGGEILLVTRKRLPAKWRTLIEFTDGSCLALNFWWFGYTHYVPANKLRTHAMTARLGPNALDLTPRELMAMTEGRRGSVKSLLLDQSKIAGIGNAYVHDILFFAGLHPLRGTHTLAEDEVETLAAAIDKGLRPSANRGGAFYELNLYGKPGGFKARHIVIGYKEGKPCPACRTTIQKIKTGSTSTFICPRCQPLKRPRKRVK